MQSHVIIALGQGWTDSLGILFAFVILPGAIVTVVMMVSIISGRGEKSQDAKIADRWGRKPSDSA